MVTSRRQDRNESAPGTRCSRTAGISDSQHPAGPSNPADAAPADARPPPSVPSGRNSAAGHRRSPPTPVTPSARTHWLPGPHTSQPTTLTAELVIRAVAGPLAINVVRQIAPSGGDAKARIAGPPAQRRQRCRGSHRTDERDRAVEGRHVQVYSHPQVGLRRMQHCDIRTRRCGPQHSGAHDDQKAGALC